MTRIFTDGAEAGDTLAWATVVGVTVVTSPVHIGGSSYRMAATAGALTTYLLTSTSEFYARFAFYSNVNTLGRLSWYKGATELGSIRRNGSGGWDIYTGTSTLQVTGTGILVNDTWYVIELHVKINDSTGVIEFKINGVLQTGFSGDTKPGSDTTVDKYNFGQGLNGSSNYMDDIAINDVAGSVDNSWVGDGHLYAIVPNADGDSSQLVGSDGNSTNNYLLVDEIPSNSDTDYVESATVGDKDQYNLAALPTLPSGSTISRVMVEVRARELVAEADTIQIGVKTGSTEAWSADKVMGISYALFKEEFLTDPDTTAAWTESGVNAMQAGVKIT